MLHPSLIRRAKQFLKLSRLAILFGILIFSNGLSLSTVLAKDTFLDLVPSETPYFMNYKMSQQTLKMVPKKLPEFQKDLSETDSAREKLLSLMLKDFIAHYNQKKLADIGLRDVKNFHFGVYGLGLWPVLNFAVKDQAKFTRWLVRNTKKAGVVVSKKGSSLNIEISSKASLILSYVSKSWINLALMPKQFAEEMLPYLNGTKKPKSNIVNSGQLASWAKEVSSSPELLSTINFERIIQSLLNHGQGFNKRFAWINDQIIKKVPQSCVSDYLELAKAIPYLISGNEQSETGKLKATFLLKLAPEIAQVTQTFSAQSAYTLKSKDYLMGLSYALNIKAIVSGLQQAFQARIQKPFTCPNLLKAGLNPQKLQMLTSQLMMVPPFIYDVVGLSVLVKEIMPNPRVQLVINAKNVSNLVNIVKSLNPRFAQIKIPAIGAPAEALQGLPIPPNYKVIAQTYQNALGLSLGDGESSDLKKSLSSKPVEKPEVVSLSYNLERFFKLIEEFLDNTLKLQRKVKKLSYKNALEQAKLNGTPLPSPPEFKDELNPLDLFAEAMKGSINMTVKFDSRGILIQSNMAGNTQP